jgi:hypothetical protein
LRAEYPAIQIGRVGVMTVVATPAFQPAAFSNTTEVRNRTKSFIGFAIVSHADAGYGIVPLIGIPHSSGG